MGRTVINQTENKQTIILNDSPEGVTGGYFDQDMVWTEIGGEQPLYALIDGEFTFSGTHWTGFTVKVEDKTKVTFENPTETPYDSYTIFNDVYNNTTSANAANIRDRVNSAVFPELKAGDEVKIIVSDLQTELFNAEGAGNIAVALRHGSTSYASTGDITEGDKEVDWIVESDVVICNIFVFTIGNVKKASFNFKLYVNGRRYC